MAVKLKLRIFKIRSGGGLEFGEEGVSVIMSTDLAHIAACMCVCVSVR